MDTTPWEPSEPGVSSGPGEPPEPARPTRLGRGDRAEDRDARPDSEGPDAEEGPPPIPSDASAATGHRATGHLALPVGGGTRARWSRIGLGGLLLLAVGLAVVGLVQRGAMDPETRDARLRALLTDIDTAELVMIDFNTALSEAFASPGPALTEVAAQVADSAEQAADALVALRPVFLGDRAGGAVESVRSAYLPHLDAWIEYLRALEEDPTILSVADDAYLLLINATAVSFREAVEEALELELEPATRALAEEILDRGFRGFDEDADV